MPALLNMLTRQLSPSGAQRQWPLSIPRFMTSIATMRSAPTLDRAANDDLAIRFAAVTTSQGAQRIAYVAQRPPVWNGKTIALVPGTGRTMRFWEPHVDHWLGMGFQVLRIDPLDTGATLGANGKVASPTLQDDAKGLVAALRGAGVSKDVYLIGHSRGGGVALLAANQLEQSGVTVRGVLPSNSFVSCLVEHANGKSRMRDFAIRLGTFDKRLASLAQMSLAARPPHESTGMDANTEIEATVEVMRGALGADIIADAAQVQAPVTLVASTGPLEPPALYAKLRAALKNPTSRQYLNEGADHFFPTSSPTAFRRIADEMLKR